MTRAEAIGLLSGLMFKGKLKEALDMAIKELEQELTPKNDLAVDCISREQALVAIRNLYPGMPRVDFNGSLRKWVDKYRPYIECDDAIKQLPSVTPREPRWIPVSERLPDTDDEVLCWYEYYHWSQEKILPEYCIGQFFDDRWFGEVGVGKDVRVIAWVPLPKPYSEVEE